MRSIKHVGIVVLSVCLLFALVGCQKGPTEEELAEMERQKLQSFSQTLFMTIHDEKDFSQYIKLYDGKQEVENTFCNDIDLIREAMAEDEDMKVLVNSDGLNFTGDYKIKGLTASATMENEMGETGKLRFCRETEDGDWYLNIDNLMGTASIQVPQGVALSLNGIPVSEDYLWSSNEYDYYTFDYILMGADSTVTYHTGFEKDFEGTIRGGVRGSQDMRYVLSDSDVRDLMPAVAKIWGACYQAAKSGNEGDIIAVMSRDAVVESSHIIDTLSKDINSKLITLSNISRYKPEGEKEYAKCYMRSKNSCILNLQANLQTSAKNGQQYGTPKDSSWQFSIELALENSKFEKMRDVTDEMWGYKTQPAQS